MRVTLGTAQLIENEVARNFEQPSGELCARDVSARAFPDSDEDLLRDIFDV
jgi:hypothetical protein